MSATATYVLREVVDDVGAVVVVRGPDAGRRFVLADRPLRVGSGPEAEIPLQDRAVSRAHCELSLELGRVRVRDLGSKNGTWVGACRVIEVEVGAGAELVVGASTLRIEVERQRLRKPVYEGLDRLGPLVGRSQPMLRLFAAIERLASSPEPVLVRGESGTGKELVARALHEGGPRASAPFVIVDGGALSRSLAESELFGHARGAFTGALVARAGALERAHGGTLFIDEIGELPIDLQPRLLRFLEEGTVQRLGETARKRVDARVVCATHRPLEAMINEGSFREDLYHRLAVVELRVPPLRDRLEDVPLIAHAALAERAGEDPQLAAMLARALAERATHRWPGNVRELKNLVRRLVALGEADGVVAPSDLPTSDEAETVEAPDVTVPMAEAKQRWIELFERRYLSRLFEESGGNVSEASRRADVDRGHLGRLLAKHGLKRR
ncbi:MAG: sigma 54-interacting transcriptional regulator [Sandaracinus sp.]